MKLKNISLSKLILKLILITFTIVQLFPLVWMVLFSLKDNADIFSGNILGLPSKFVWSNYKVAFTSGNVGRYLFNSVIVTGVTVAFSGVFASMVSFAICRMKWKLSKHVLTYFLLGLMVPLHAVLLPLFLQMRDLKLLNSYWALIIPYVVFAMPMAILILTGFLTSVPKELEEAAVIDGCGIYKLFSRMILPIIAPALATISIFTFLLSWNELMFAQTFITDAAYKTLTVGINSMVGQYSTDWGPIGAGLVITTIPTLAIYILMSKQLQRSFTAGAVKG